MPIRLDELRGATIPTTDALRALSLAENEGWAKIPGLPEGTPDHVVADLGRGLDLASGEWADRALLCGPTEEIEVYHLVFYTLDEAPLVQLATH